MKYENLHSPSSPPPNPTPNRMISTAVVRQRRYLMCAWKMSFFGRSSATLRMVSLRPSKYARSLPSSYLEYGIDGSVIFRIHTIQGFPDPIGDWHKCHNNRLSLYLVRLGIPILSC